MVTDTASMVNSYLTKTKPIKLTAPKEEMVSYKNKRTGQTYTAPKGVDPGFEFNQGKVEAAQKSAAKVYHEKAATAIKVITGDTSPLSTSTPVSNGLSMLGNKHKQSIDHV